MKTRNENGLAKWVKAMVPFEEHKRLKKLALDMDISLAEVIRRALKLFPKKGGGIT